MSLPRLIREVDEGIYSGVKSNISNAQVYDALVRMYCTMTDAWWALACADLSGAGMPAEDRHARYVGLLSARGEREAGR